MNDDMLIQKLSAILLERGTEKPWMTAEGLSNRLRKEAGHDINPKRIEAVLRHHAQMPGRSVRYSYYPSRKTLDILWGHINNVKEMELPSLQRIDEPIEDTAGEVDEQAPWFFISHNSGDAEHVFQLREALIRQGYGAWIFETEIPQNAEIIATVGEAIKRCAYFIVYVSARSLGSLWVQKEVEQALQGGHITPFIFLDGTDEHLLRLFDGWGQTEGEEGLAYNIAEEFCVQSATRIGGNRDFSRSLHFLRTLHEYIRRTHRVVVFPDPQYVWHNQTLRMETLQEFIGSIRGRIVPLHLE